MKTSAIRHPKREHAITVHSWMLKVTSKNLYAANLLAYLEGKFNLMLDLEQKNGGWLKLNKIQIKNGIFADSWDYYNSAIDTLKSLDFVAVDEDGSDEFPLNDLEIWVKFDALKINEWLDDYCKKKGDKESPIVEYLPYFVFLGQHYFQEVPESNVLPVEIKVEPVQQPLIEVGEKVRKPRTRKNIELDNTLIGTAKELFSFWKVKTGHKRSNLQDKYAKMCIDRIKDGYTPDQIAQGIIGLTYSDFHIQNNYDHFEYVVRNTKGLDKFCDLAETHGVSVEDAHQMYSVFLEQLRSGVEVQYESATFKNPTTGRELK